MDPAGGSVSTGNVLLAQHAPKGQDAAVVFWVDMFLLSALTLCTISQLPRIFARLSSPDERRSGHLLYRSALRPSLSRSVSTQSDNSFARLVKPSGDKEKEGHVSAPRHVPAWSTTLRSTTAVLRTRFQGRIHLGGTSLLAFYFATLLFAGVYRSSLFTNQVRAGYVAVSQIPWVVVLASKNNMISMLLGIGWDHLNYIHRFSGRLMVIAANVHTVGFIYRWTIQGKFTRHISQPRYIWGLVAIVCIDILFFFSLALWRHRAYNVFFLTHVVAFVVFLVAVCLHMHACLPYVSAGAGIYVLDVLFRFLKTRVCVARICAIPELSMTSVQVPMLNAGWRAGQHVRLRVLSVGMGWYGWAETHPFTIASASRGAAQDGLVLLCKNTGRWTRNLYGMASSDAEPEGCAITVKVMVEGPYGGPGNTILSSFSGALFIVGGSGISYALASAEELLQKAVDGRSSVTVMDLIWCVHHPDSLAPLLPTFSSLLLQSATTTMSLQISVFYTRAETADHAFAAFDLPAGVTLSPGHPNVNCRLQDLVERTTAASLLPGCGDKPRGVIAGVCGPIKLGEAVRQAIDDLHPEQHRAVGGIELNEEIYSL